MILTGPYHTCQEIVSSRVASLLYSDKEASDLGRAGSVCWHPGLGAHPCRAALRLLYSHGAPCTVYLVRQGDSCTTRSLHANLLFACRSRRLPTHGTFCALSSRFTRCPVAPFLAPYRGLCTRVRAARNRCAVVGRGSFIPVYRAKGTSAVHTLARRILLAAHPSR